MIIYIIKIFSLIVFLLSLIFLSFKLDKFSYTRKYKYTKVLDIVRIDKHSSIVTLKVGKEGVLLGVSSSNISKIKDISKEDIIEIEKDLQNNKDDINKVIFNIKNKLKYKKEG